MWKAEKRRTIQTLKDTSGGTMKTRRHETITRCLKPPALAPIQKIGLETLTIPEKQNNEAQSQTMQNNNERLDIVKKDIQTTNPGKTENTQTIWEKLQLVKRPHETKPGNVTLKHAKNKH